MMPAAKKPFLQQFYSQVEHTQNPEAFSLIAPNMICHCQQQAPPLELLIKPSVAIERDIFDI